MNLDKAKDYALSQFVQLEREKAVREERTRILEGLLLQGKYSNNHELNLVREEDVVRIITTGVIYPVPGDNTGFGSGGNEGGHPLTPSQHTDLEKLIYSALGEASMCWSEVPTGVFRAGDAKKVGDMLIAELFELMNPTVGTVEKREVKGDFGKGKSQKNRRIQRLRSENHNLRVQIEKLQKKEVTSTGVVLSDGMKDEIKSLLTKCYFRNAKGEICESQGHISGHVSKSSIWAERVDRVLENLGIVEPLVEPTEFGTKVIASYDGFARQEWVLILGVDGQRQWFSKDGLCIQPWKHLINPKLVEK